MERREWRQHYLRAARKHPLTSVQSSPASVLNFLDFGTSLSNDRTHSRVGNHELDGDCSASGNRRLVKRFVIDPTDNETERLENHTFNLSGLGVYSGTNLGDSIKGSADVEDSLWVARNTF